MLKGASHYKSRRKELGLYLAFHFNTKFSFFGVLGYFFFPDDESNVA